MTHRVDKRAEYDELLNQTPFITNNQHWQIGEYVQLALELHSCPSASGKTEVKRRIQDLVRTQFTEGPVDNSKDYLFLVGGSQNAGQFKFYDWQTASLHSIAGPTIERSRFGVVSLNRKIYLIGGYQGQQALATGECYDPDTNQWTPIAPMAQARAAFGICHLKGFIYVVSGSEQDARSVERYDPCTDSWSSMASLNGEKFPGSCQCVALDECILAIGTECTQCMVLTVSPSQVDQPTLEVSCFIFLFPTARFGQGMVLRLSILTSAS